MDKKGKMDNLPIEKQVCSLEQAKELAELLGYDAPGSLWVSVEYEYRGEIKRQLILTSSLSEFGRLPENKVVGVLSVYTGDELGVLLPEIVDGYKLRIIKDNDEFQCGYMLHSHRILALCYEQTEAEAKAALAIQGLRIDCLKKEDFRYGD